MDVIDLNDLEPKAEAGKSAALIEGVASRLKPARIQHRRFNAVTTTDVFSGSGISSSAAFGVLWELSSTTFTTTAKSLP